MPCLAAGIGWFHSSIVFFAVGGFRQMVAGRYRAILFS